MLLGQRYRPQIRALSCGRKCLVGKLRPAQGGGGRYRANLDHRAGGHARVRGAAAFDGGHDVAAATVVGCVLIAEALLLDPGAVSACGEAVERAKPVRYLKQPPSPKSAWARLQAG